MKGMDKMIFLSSLEQDGDWAKTDAYLYQQSLGPHLSVHIMWKDHHGADIRSIKM